MGAIGPFDIAYCSHALEHLAPHEIAQALGEFHRVLAPHGFLIVIVPNLEGVTPDHTVRYVSPAGPITGLDMYYGKASLVAENPYMAHKYGFVKETLTQFLNDAGFTVKYLADTNHNLMVTAQR